MPTVVYRNGVCEIGSRTTRTFRKPIHQDAIGMSDLCRLLNRPLLDDIGCIMSLILLLEVSFVTVLPVSKLLRSTIRLTTSRESQR